MIVEDRLSADGPADPEALRELLAPAFLADRLPLLGFSREDAADLTAVLPVALDDLDLCRAVVALSRRLARSTGLLTQPADGPYDLPPQDPALGPMGGEPGGPVSGQAVGPAVGPADGPGNGSVDREVPAHREIESLPLIIACVATCQAVREFHYDRGLSDAKSWASLADLGQQLRVSRAVSGRFGLQTPSWVALAWTGRLFRFGRLQFDLHQETDPTSPVAMLAPVSADGGTWTIGTHIPADGPLDPESVDLALYEARSSLRRAFRELGPLPVVCESWLLDPQLVDLLGQESNLVAFQRRWIPVAAHEDRDALEYFVYGHRRGTVTAPDRLDRSTRLRAGIADLLARGGTWHGVEAVLEE